MCRILHKANVKYTKFCLKPVYLLDLMGYGKESSLANE